MPRPIITLTTDFGLSDHFVGAMKGVILKILPGAAIVDICHGIGPFQIPEAAFAISQAYPCFPGKTVHVVVVDPGVGTQRRPILAEAAGQYFVAPDNGVLSMIFSREKCKVRQITASRYFLSPVSATFHGRDIFAPVAAHLSRGLRWSELGEAGADYVRLRWPEPVARRGVVLGEIVYLDRFGNGITNLDAPTLGGAVTAGIVRLGRRMVGPVQTCYASVAPGAAVAVIGSSGLLEIAVNGGSAAQRFRLRVGDPVSVVGAPAVASPGRM